MIQISHPRYVNNLFDIFLKEDLSFPLGRRGGGGGSLLVSRKEVLAMAGIIQNIGGPPRGIDIPSIEPQGIDGRTWKGSEGEKQHRGRWEEGRRVT
jgi:hypothetical protein